MTREEVHSPTAVPFPLPYCSPAPTLVLPLEVWDFESSVPLALNADKFSRHQRTQLLKKCLNRNKIKTLVFLCAHSISYEI